MDLNVNLAPRERAQLEQEVAAYNKAIGAGTDRSTQTELGKDDFLRILVTQLSHQDPTQPMEDREFISQMAQFSSLEQITNMSEGMSRVAGLLASSKALDLLGQTVVLGEGADTVTGIVDEVSGGDYPQILVNGQYYDAGLVQSILRTRAKE